MTQYQLVDHKPDLRQRIRDEIKDLKNGIRTARGTAYYDVYKRNLRSQIAAKRLSLHQLEFVNIHHLDLPAQPWIRSARPKASIIIPTHNNAFLIQQCLTALTSTCKGISVEIIVIDNGSNDNTAMYLHHISSHYRNIVPILLKSNQGYARANNIGLATAKGDYIVFLNDDTVPQAGWLRCLLAAFRHKDVGIAGPRLLYPPGSEIQHCGIVFDDYLRPTHLYYRMPSSLESSRRLRFFNALTGACLAGPKWLFDRVGGFDERFNNGSEDIDLCLRVRQLKLNILYVPTSTVFHYESMTEGRRAETCKNEQLFTTKWGHLIRPDWMRVFLEDQYFMTRFGPFELLSHYWQAFGKKHKVGNYLCL